MSKQLTSLFTVLFLACGMHVQGQGSFCGAVGTEGCDAIAHTHPAIIGWATGCTVVRGPVDIVDPNGPHVRFGEESYGTGVASLDTRDAVSLGDGGSAVLTFESPIRNVAGPDFAVFENSFNDSFLELAFVEVSTDGEHYVRFPSTSLTPTATQVGSNGSVNPTKLNNLAGKYRIGYGTPFDLEELRDSAGIDIDSIVYVRVVDVVGTINPQYATHDAYGHMVNDPYPTKDTIWASGGFDLTGVAVLSATMGIYESPAEPVTVIWPNPATDRVKVSCNSGQRVSLYSTDGRLVRDSRAMDGCATFDLRGLATGVYIVRTGGWSGKVVKH